MKGILDPKPPHFKTCYWVKMKMRLWLIIWLNGLPPVQGTLQEPWSCHWAEQKDTKFVKQINDNIIWALYDTRSKIRTPILNSQSDSVFQPHVNYFIAIKKHMGIYFKSSSTFLFFFISSYLAWLPLQHPKPNLWVWWLNGYSLISHEFTSGK